MNKFTQFVLFLSAIFIVMASSAWAVPLTGSSVSIGSVQYTMSNTNIFTTAVDGSVSGGNPSAAGENTVFVAFLDSAGNTLSSFTNATLELAPVDFSGGFSSGTGGGFIIRDSADRILLSGQFGSSSLSSSSTGAEFESSMIVNFTNTDLTGVQFYAPGLFSATLGNVGTLALNDGFTTRGSATAQILSSPAPVPEPSTHLLLGLGFVIFGVWRSIRLRNWKHVESK